ncbi:MAG TPA: hypothetical protein VGR08_12040, partial [Thermomicrobiales bacterium]|nr:hypothetical protein [Thermomicrobiales bacterium]
MAETTASPATSRNERTRQTRLSPAMLGLAILPLLLLAGVLLWIVRTDAGLGERTAPPIETLSVQRVRLPEPGLIELDVVNDGPDPITISQVLVDEAYWQFTMEPGGPLDRLDSATIAIPYPWVQDEGHGIALITETGVVFEAEIPVAIASPEADGESFARLALVGLYVGFVPVGLGLLWYPFMRRLGRGAMNFILALTVGLLLFLVVDMWEAAQEVAIVAPSSLDPAV